jgi:hypothetical protein
MAIQDTSSVFAQRSHRPDAGVRGTVGQTHKAVVIGWEFKHAWIRFDSPVRIPVPFKHVAMREDAEGVVGVVRKANVVGRVRKPDKVDCGVVYNAADNAPSVAVFFPSPFCSM